MKLTEYDATNINLMRDIVHEFNVKQGWHDTSNKLEAVVSANAPELLDVVKAYHESTLLALIHSEVSEAVEGRRKGLMDDHLPTRPMVEVELADALIRILDLCGRRGYDIGGAVVEKFKYNSERADHKAENRAKDGGKKF